MSFHPTVNREFGDWVAVVAFMKARNIAAHSDMTARRAWARWSWCFGSRSAAESRTSATSGLQPRAVTRTILSAHA